MELLTAKLQFPDPSQASDEGLLAIGGDLSVERLLLAYRSGIFPWYSQDEPILWWSPNPRMVFDLRTEKPLRITKSMRQSARNRGFEIRENTSFRDVISACASIKRKHEDSTWISPEIIDAYCKLHKLNHAKSIEVFHEDELVGGLYGIDMPERGIFYGESMFSAKTDASKVALMYLVRKLQEKNYQLIDAQVYNSHLERLGAVEMNRNDFLRLIRS